MSLSVHMDFEPYHWVAHRAALERYVRLSAQKRKPIHSKLDQLCQHPFDWDYERFELPEQAPYFIVPVGVVLLTIQVDHTVRELRLLAIE